MTIGEKIKHLRKSKGISQEQLANELKINRNFLSRIETEKSEPTATILKNIAVLFHISLDSLLDVSNNQQSQEDKIKQITNNCYLLKEEDLNFLLRIISVMREEYVKTNTTQNEK